MLKGMGKEIFAIFTLKNINLNLCLWKEYEKLLNPCPAELINMAYSLLFFSRSICVIFAVFLTCIDFN